MKSEKMSEEQSALNILCASVRKLVDSGDYTKSRELILSSLAEYPHEPQPHNLLGVLLEKENDHIRAMKHFRAALALEPTYLPARQNLECYGTFHSIGKCAFDESDCISGKQSRKNIFSSENDSHGISNVLRRK